MTHLFFPKSLKLRVSERIPSEKHSPDNKHQKQGRYAKANCHICAYSRTTIFRIANQPNQRKKGTRLQNEEHC
jgi:hypothetical protein